MNSNKVTTSAVCIRQIDDWMQNIKIWQPAGGGEQHGPGFVFIHGGGFQEGSPDEAEDLGTQLAVRLGITTFSIQYRLASPEKPTYPHVLGDVEFAWRWIINQAAEWNVDANRLAVGGRSAGAHLSALALALGLLPGARAMVAQWGPMDFVTRWHDAGEQPRAESVLLGKNYPDNPTLYHIASPVTHFRNGLPPAIFIYGNQDRVVQARQGELGAAAWSASGNKAEIHRFDNIGHSVVGDNSEQMRAVMAKTIEFLKAHLDIGVCGRSSMFISK